MNDLFDGVQDNLPPVDENTDYFAELVGENKKFKDEKALAKGKYEADLYVKTLEGRLDEMRRDYEEARKQNMAGARLEELIDRLNKSSNSNSETNPPAKEDENTPPTTKPEDIEQIVLTKLQEAKIKEREDSNYESVQAKLRERFGHNAANVLEQQRQTLGLSVDDTKALARKSPAAFFRLMQLDQAPRQDGFQSPPRTQIRNDNFLPNVQKRTWSWYQDIKKKDRALYYAPKTIAQMHRDHAELGKEFEDGDYHN